MTMTDDAGDAPADTIRLTAEEGVAACSLLGLPDLLVALRPSESDDDDEKILEAMQGVGLRSLLARRLIDVRTAPDGEEPAVEVLEPLTSIIGALAASTAVVVCQRWGGDEVRADVDVVFAADLALIHHLPFDLIHEFSIVGAAEGRERLFALVGLREDQGVDGDPVEAAIEVLDADADTAKAPSEIREAMSFRLDSVQIDVIRRGTENGESDQFLWFRSPGQAWLLEPDEDRGVVACRRSSTATLRTSLAAAIDDAP